ncbi:TonB-linked outer membrane protein, SusC/RagA family [Chitinophaga niabensis]|uniref:TonB-linked outer membrane protein, SusC/RagA family n=2 Tax=Chitinophaga niabensis TaxID=536979 RepID=A0A1N6E341_9BACT|nr:TonB-linked outer membrane protein, SusC/RagA family [Chitinophaga niabensis]
MRIHIAAFLISICCLNAFSEAKAQKVTLQLKQVELETVFRAIEKQTDYSFAYGVALLAGSKPVTIQLNKVSVTEALDQIFSDLPYRYEIVNKTILIKPKAQPTNQPTPEKAKPIRVKGRVTDIKNIPLPAVSIRVRGTNIGTVTDQNGYYSIEAEPDASLVFSSVGFQTIQIKINNQTEINLTLPELTAQLKEITIQTGYEAIKPERFVGAATVVDSTILQRQVSTNLLSRLDGTTGLLFDKRSLSSFLLRGVSTLNTSQDLNGMIAQNPLIILDDFPFTGEIANLNPNDIESVSILKDAVATSIWGSRAGNGVVVIKTKTGSYNKKASVNITSNVAITTKPDLFYMPQMSSSEFIDMEMNLFGKGFYNTAIQFPSFFSVSPVVDILAKQRAGSISETQAQEQINSLRSIDVRNEARKHVYRQGINNQNFVNISAGSNTMNYSLSFGADNNKSTLQGPGGRSRYTINSNIRFKPILPLELMLGIEYNHDKYSADGNVYPGSPGRGFLYPYARLADENDNHLTVPTSFGSAYLASLPADKLLDWNYRPLDERDLVDNTNTTNLLRMNFGTNLKVNSWLSADVKYQYTRQTLDGRNMQDVKSFFTRDLINKFTAPTNYARAIPVGGILDLRENELTSHNLRGQLNVRKNWNGIHDFTALVAGEFSAAKLDESTRTVYGYDEELLRYSPLINYAIQNPLFLGGTQQIPNNVNFALQNNNLVSILMNTSYTYKSRYGVYFSARKDGSNLFGVSTNNKYKPLWSLGGRWNIGNEMFYKATWLPTLALRLSYGYAGNSNNSVSALATISQVASPNIYGQNYVTPLTAPNPNLRWEEVRTSNAGIDFGLFKGRVSGTIDVYRKKSKDVIAAFPLDPSLGITGSQIRKNAANLTTKGFDFALQTQNVRSMITWTTNFNVFYAKTTVSKFFQETKNVQTGPIIREGDIYGAIYAYGWAGLDPTNGDPRGYIGKTISNNYQAIFNDSLKNQQYVGSTLPLLYGNILNTMTYSGFSLSANISYRAQYYFRKPSIDYNALYNSSANHSDYLNRWQKPGDEKITNIPSMPYPANANRDKFYAYSAVNFEKGDHIRLQDVRLAYTWNNKGDIRWPIKGVELYTYIGNINILLWKETKSNYDPDFANSMFPPPTTYSFGLNIKL